MDSGQLGLYKLHTLNPNIGSHTLLPYLKVHGTYNQIRALKGAYKWVISTVVVSYEVP